MLASFLLCYGVSDCIREVKVVCFCWVILVMASMTVVVGATFGTLNSMMPRYTDVGYDRRAVAGTDALVGLSA